MHVSMNYRAETSLYNDKTSTIRQINGRQASISNNYFNIKKKREKNCILSHTIRSKQRFELIAIQSIIINKIKDFSKNKNETSKV